MLTPIPVTITAGTLAPPACYSSEAERYLAYIAATTASIAGTTLQWVVGSLNPPNPGDQGKGWLKTDVNGYPQEILFWVPAVGTWVRIFTVPHYPVSSGGVANALTVTFNPTFLTRSVGERFWFIASVANTGACTLTVDSLAAANIVKGVTLPLVEGDILAGQVVEVTWDGTNYQMVSSLGGGNNEVNVANLAPGTERQVIRGIGDPTVVPVWQELISATANQSIPAAGAVVTVAHGLTVAGTGVKPGYVRWVLICTTADNGYAVGDEVDAQDVFFDNANTQYNWSKMEDITNLKLIRDANATALWMPSKTGGTASFNAITEGSWRAKAYYA